MSALQVALAGLLLSVVTAGGGYVYGLAQGKTLERGEQAAKAVDAITAQLAAHAALVKRSSAASRELRNAVALREQADKKSSEELSHELAETADSRAGCVFPAGVMRNLAAARDRAAEAAARGIRGAVPEPAASAADAR